MWLNRVNLVLHVLGKKKKVCLRKLSAVPIFFFFFFLVNWQKKQCLMQDFSFLLCLKLTFFGCFKHFLAVKNKQKAQNELITYMQQI